jgi:tRNA-binding protein
VGRIIVVEEFPEAKTPSFWLTIDFGPEIGVKRSSAALGEHYAEDALHSRLVVAVTNFPPKQVGPHMSHVLVLAAVDPDGSLCLIQPDGEVELGARIR